MEKIKNFFAKWFDDEFGSALISLIIVTTISITVQCILLWTDALSLVSEFNLGTLSFGMVLDIVLFVAILVFALWTNNGPDTFIFLGTMGKGRVCLLFLTLSVIAAYISVIFVYQWWVLLLSIAVLFLSEYALRRLKADDDRINLAFGIALIYCVGAYFAMLINNLEPTIDLWGLFAIMVTSIILYFKPAFEY